MGGLGKEEKETAAGEGRKVFIEEEYRTVWEWQMPISNLRSSV